MESELLVGKMTVVKDGNVVRDVFTLTMGSTEGFQLAWKTGNNETQCSSAAFTSFSDDISHFSSANFAILSNHFEPYLRTYPISKECARKTLREVVKTTV